MAEGEGDFVIQVSSDMIAEVMGKYFNKEMFKKEVEIAGLKPLEDGYMFVLAYVQGKKQRVVDKVDKADKPVGIDYGEEVRVEYQPPQRSIPIVESIESFVDSSDFPARNKKGQFVKGGKNGS